MIIRILLNHIESNPYQTRTSMGDVSELAASIEKFQYTRRETSGLLQVPPARLWDRQAKRSLDPANLDTDEISGMFDGGDLVVQLAAGHRRWAAFNLLLTGGDLNYATFPVDLQELSDEAMADIAWAENAQREDISPIEAALALQRDMQAFGWTQEQIGQRRGLSRSAVANKLRLLQLPDEAQAAIDRGDITERHGRVLLAAKAKSPTIYNRVAASLIAPTASEEHAAQAREMLAEVSDWDINTVPAASDDPACAVCGGPLSPDGDVNARFHHDNKRIFLCPSCYRAGSDWSVPSVADAENRLENVTRWESNRLSDAKFPLNEPVPGAGDAQAEICTQCPYYDEQLQVCLDKDCFQHKTNAFFAHQQALLLQRLQNDYPDRQEWQIVGEYGHYELRHHDEIVDEYGHYELRHHDEIDRALWAEQCPSCEKCLIRHYSYLGSTYTYVYEDLPFIAVCKHAASRNACARRWQAEHADQAETAREAQAKIEREHARVRTDQILDRAVRAFSVALLAGVAGAWQALVTNIDASLDGRPASNKDTDIASHCAHAVARKALNTTRTIDMLTAGQINYNQVEGRLRQQFASWGLTFPESPDDIAHKLDRMTQFLMDDAGHLRGDLLPEQIAGNLENLEDLNNRILQMANDNLLSDDDYTRLEEWIQRLYEPLFSILYVSQETPAEE